jgi:hypothetical protein
LVNPVPNLFLVRVKDVRSVSVNRYTALDLGVAVTANVVAFLNNHNLLALVVQVLGANRTEETRTYNGEVVTHSSMMPIPK